MNTTEQTTTGYVKPVVHKALPDEAEFDRNFRPKGAIAFFILLILLGAIIWYGIFFLMLQRA